MKTRIILIVILLSSCAPGAYYQVFNTQTVEQDILLNQDSVIYADSVCLISYDLWSEGGTSGFWIYNGSDRDMLIHLDKTFLVINGVAYPYYSNTFRNPMVTDNAVYYYPGITPFERLEIWSRSLDAGKSSYYMPERIVRIPHGTWRFVDGLNINSNLYKNCDLEPYPMGSRMSKLQFDASNSPLRFNNRVVYSMDGDSALTFEINNRFYINEITNYPQYQIRKVVEVQNCNETVTKRINTEEAYNRFYLRYVFND